MPRQKLIQRQDGRYKVKYHGIQFYGRTQKEAQDKRDAYKRAEAAGELLAKTLTVAEYAAQWLPLHKAGVSDKCYNDYARQLDKLCSVIGAQPLADVSVDAAAAVWKAYAGYSASTIHRAKMLYVSLFDAAIENEYCRKNPFRSRFTAPPKAPSGSHRALEPWEISLILRTPHRFQVPALIMLYAGLRRGELLALRRDDVDLAAGVIHVTKAVRFESNQPILTTPKTAAGRRDVPILDVLAPFLSNLPDPVAIRASGEMMSDVAFRRAWASWLHALTESAGRPVQIRAHDLRHTFCTMLCDAGVDMHQAMIWMGHSDEKMILHIYDHAGAHRQQTALGQLNALASGVQNGVQPFRRPRKTLAI
ncbi:MAG: site-specific integrase [Clostridia bacterium]|nr:site-specific integrase [Clostridia bacterium]MBR6185928.1 site-specific integrase [Clostridia bacterium]